MKIEYYDKLVRDHIPEVIRKSGDVPITHMVCDEITALKYLSKKLREETEEFLQEFHISELIDIIDVLEAFANRLGFSCKEIGALQMAKRESNGGFEKGVILDKVIRMNPGETD